MAIFYDNFELFKLFIEEGSELNIKDSFGETSIDLLNFLGRTEFLDYLIDIEKNKKNEKEKINNTINNNNNNENKNNNNNNNNNEIIISIDDSDNNNKEIKINKNLKIINLKKLIEEKYKIQIENQKLLFQGNELNDTDEITKISKESKIFLIQNNLKSNKDILNNYNNFEKIHF
jgi:hypothetical protein